MGRLRTIGTYGGDSDIQSLRCESHTDLGATLRDIETRWRLSDICRVTESQRRNLSYTDLWMDTPRSDTWGDPERHDFGVRIKI